jgi:hypothetical protein
MLEKKTIIEAPKLNQKAFNLPLNMATLAAVKLIKPGKTDPTMAATKPIKKRVIKFMLFNFLFQNKITKILI